MTEDERRQRKESRKWQITKWAAALATVGFLTVCAATLLGKEVSAAMATALTTLCAVPIAYIGGNVYQKTLGDRDGKM